jgi:DNA-binding PadR family transcriptional regulator
MNMLKEQQLTTLEYALLGLVAMAPMSGYDVHKLFATTPLAHFSSSPGAIYPALRRLEKRGLLKAALDRKTETRPRRVYSLTPAGEAGLEAWLRQPVTREELVRGEGAPILRFSLAGQRLPRRELLAYLGTYRRALEAYVEELEGYLPGLAEEGMLVARLALESGIGGFHSQSRWVKRAAAELEKKRSSRPRRRRG